MSKVTIFEKDGSKYVLREEPKSHDGWTLDHYPSGAKKATLKIRLGQ